MHYTETDFTCLAAFILISIFYYFSGFNKKSFLTGLFVAVIPSGCDAKAATLTPAIKQAVTQSATKHHIDPNLVLSVIEVESTFNPNATGKAGEIGLMQLHPRFFPNASYKIDLNVEQGVQHLIYWQKHCPQKANLSWVQCFNSGYQHFSPERAPYFLKVMKAFSRRTSSHLVSR